MADNIFDATLDVDNDVKVNNFDWSHANNLTTQIGRITPIFCDLVPAKTSFRVNPRFGLQFMPMVFPIQTRMKARISFFRYPLRALWKDYKDFIGNFREGLEEPYIDFNSTEKLRAMGSTGSLGDYLGLPTTHIGKYGQPFNLTPVWYPGYEFVPYSTQVLNTDIDLTDDDIVRPYFIGRKLGSILDSDIEVRERYCGMSYAFSADIPMDTPAFELRLGVTTTVESTWDNFVANSTYLFFDSSRTCIGVSSGGTDSEGIYVTVNPGSYGSPVRYVAIIIKARKSDNSSTGIVSTVTGPIAVSTIGNDFKPSVLTGSYSVTAPSDVTLASSPWYNSESANKDKQQKILAYGFRAYEGIYNSFIRDNRNNPYYLNGQVQYNTWIPNDAGGADDTLYELRYANWEKDFLTTAVQSPQQGNAPLVGITTYTQTVSNDDGTRTELVKTALVDEDGKKYGLSFKTSDEGLEGVEYLELDNGTAVRQARSLYDLATSGISIPDLRMVNCYQKFLELNMRKGYSYKDIVEGRFAVKVRYADLLLPEFFGGVSRDIDVNSVTQTVDQNAVSGSGDYATALGSQSGLAGVRGEANANIECFCDEESIIMGILVVTPLPVYTQLLPKHFTYRGLMEHYQPEFNLIGFQPIKYNEVCPIQAYNANPDTLTETFGYNRPWYEYVQKYDVAHGLFRTSLSNFLMHRVFNEKPELAQSFLLVDPEQVTDVFAVTETTDKIYGQIWLDCTCKLPIARVAIPRLD
ncbi:hypothetical protein F6S82_26350 [Bacteroides xylanisolvens]|jgi:hypothetical protein|uniref:Major capsid protein n=1 Tax=Bacteroides xylanisolvens TaxID=371601 RepID=A0AAI9RWG5_9BACE|nr:major capsid protein [Bacteroides xylanisolvens]KAA9034580.1 hypothetical protein F6S82_26350 [Bacteroides xylanisolvens]QDH55778.1 hypothetical protein FKZ68_16810 [Bacteroides xylanisolvens]